MAPWVIENTMLPQVQRCLHSCEVLPCFQLAFLVRGCLNYDSLEAESWAVEMEMAPSLAGTQSFYPWNNCLNASPHR